MRVRDQYPQESEVIVHQARIKSRHMPTRDLIQHAPHVLRALKPCWAMSPLVVSQLLPASVRRDGDGPAEPMFDVVIFDEASQILPADAVPALLRGRQAIVAGDPKQLPPTTFFTTLSDDPQEEEDDEDQAVVDVSLTKDFESLLDVMQTLIPGGARTLQWHYRSKDERLIAFSNHHIYDGKLVTFPAPARPTASPTSKSPSAKTPSPAAPPTPPKCAKSSTWSWTTPPDGPPKRWA